LQNPSRALTECSTGGKAILTAGDEVATALLAAGLRDLGAKVELVDLFPCLCCGFLTIDEPGGNYEICHLCGWEDDPVQAANPDFAGGANRESLRTAQAVTHST
jgi:hypothetical protein